MAARIVPVTVNEGVIAKARQAQAAGRLTDELFNREQESLSRDYPDEWVAIGPGGVLAHSRTERGLARMLDRLPETEGLRVHFIARERPTLIL